MTIEQQRTALKKYLNVLKQYIESTNRCTAELLERYEAIESQLIRIDLVSIYSAVKQVTEITTLAIKSDTKNRDVCDARHLFCKIAYSNEYTMNELAQELNKDRCTILNSIKQATERPDLKLKYNQIVQQLTSSQAQ